MKYLLIVIKVINGEYEHHHHCLYSTNCKNLDYAAQYYTAHFWGYGCRSEKDYWLWQDGVLAGRLEKYTEVSKEDFEKLENMFY